jgi:hypothetical protein
MAGFAVGEGGGGSFSKDLGYVSRRLRKWRNNPIYLSLSRIAFSVSMACCRT